MPLPESGSARKYFRLTTENKSYIGTYHAVTQENQAFVSFARHFFKKRPCCATGVGRFGRLQRISSNGLRRHKPVQAGAGRLNQGDFHPLLIDYYKDALNNLLKFQFIGHRDLDYSLAFPTSHFDEKKPFVTTSIISSIIF